MPSESDHTTTPPQPIWAPPVEQADYLDEERDPRYQGGEKYPMPLDEIRAELARRNASSNASR